ncbi:hypothetical protein MKZ38_003322 [Zalerion maritima]|uniref:BTB domain-containing protein n=1 Tax=Zalerion maritima TaxID=339359 RepID=A0AAD5RMZ0_9PEZI|nr:hypothetical protein MKZ38_003322 [Zalerion maritima]
MAPSKNTLQARAQAQPRTSLLRFSFGDAAASPFQTLNPPSQASTPNAKRDLSLMKPGPDYGMLSDAKIRCREGEKVTEWPVHRLILCSRSPYFKGALTGGFVETETGIMDFQDEIHPLHMQIFLEFIYSGVLLNRKMQNATTLAHLYHLGEYFQTPELCTQVTKALVDNLEEACFSMNTSISPKEKAGLKAVRELLDAASIAYGTTFCPYPHRNAFIRTILRLWTERQLLHSMNATIYEEIEDPARNLKLGEFFRDLYRFQDKNLRKTFGEQEMYPPQNPPRT